MKCQFCEKEQREEQMEPIVDGETLQQILVCQDCHNKVFPDPERIREELNKQIEHQREEKNEGALRSLLHLNDILNGK